MSVCTHSSHRAGKEAYRLPYGRESQQAVYYGVNRINGDLEYCDEGLAPEKPKKVRPKNVDRKEEWEDSLLG